MPLSFIRQDITRLEVDAIVNAANEGLRAGGGVCGAIFAAAGRDDLQQACDEIGHVDTGSAVATPGFALPARHIIHTAGPVWRGGTHEEGRLLASCYRSSLELARDLGDKSVAFPLISSGIYGYPPAEALSVAVGAIRTFLIEQPDMEVTLCLFDRKATTLTQGLFGAIAHYVDDTYVDENQFARKRWELVEEGGWWSSTQLLDNAPMPAPSQVMTDAARPTSAAPETGLPAQGQEQAHSYSQALPMEFAGGHTGAQTTQITSLDDMLAHLDEPFPLLLLGMIDERGLTDAQVYARANLSRQYFSKLRSGKVNPSKRVVLSLAIALKLSLGETRLLLERAGHALTHASRFDIIVEWFIRSGRYDVFEINEALFAFDQPLLGAS